MRLAVAFTAAWLLAPPLPSPAAEKLDLNRATARELEALPGIGAERARQIVRMRRRNGPFRCVEELRALPRISERDLRRILPLVQTSGGRPRSDCAALEAARRRNGNAAPRR